MATIFDSSSIAPISTQNATFFVEIESNTTERTSDSGALAACFFLAFTLGAFSALLSKVCVVFQDFVEIIYRKFRFIIYLKNHETDHFSTIRKGENDYAMH